MFETNSLVEMQKQNGAGACELNIFYYVAYYPYLNG